MLIKFWSLMLAFMIPVSVPSVSYRRLAQRDLQSSVLLHMTGLNEKGQRVLCGCSGTYISDSRILTAAHCFEGYDAKKIWARGPFDPIGYRVKIERLDSKVDLALLDAPLKHPFVKLGRNPHVGDEVLNIGSPLDYEFAVSEGIVSICGFHSPGMGGYFMITTAMINSGSSGGGAFNEKGQLIGVNTRLVGPFGWHGISLAVDLKTIREFLR